MRDKDELGADAALGLLRQYHATAKALINTERKMRASTDCLNSLSSTFPEEVC